MERIYLIPTEETVERVSNTGAPGRWQDGPGPVEKQHGGPTEKRGSVLDPRLAPPCVYRLPQPASPWLSLVEASGERWREKHQKVRMWHLVFPH